MPKVLFSLTTTPIRAPHIAPCIGALAVTPDSEVCINYSGVGLPDFSHLTNVHVLPRPISVDSDGPFVKYFGLPHYENPDYVLVCDDDNVYSQNDIAAVIAALDAGTWDYAYQARGIGGLFKPGRPEIKWAGGFTTPRKIDVISATCLVGFHYREWLALRQSVLNVCDLWTKDERMADDYTASEILRRMGVTVWALPIAPGFPQTYALPYHNLTDALHKTDGGNNKRYLTLAKRDMDRGNPWWNASSQAP